MHSRVERSRYVAAKLKNPLKPLLKNADCIRFRLPAPTKIWEKVAPKHAISDTTTGPAWQADPFFPPRSGFVQPPPSANPAMSSFFHTECRWRGVAEVGR